MKVTKTQLRQIIREELTTLEEQSEKLGKMEQALFRQIETLAADYPVVQNVMISDDESAEKAYKNTPDTFLRAAMMYGRRYKKQGIVSLAHRIHNILRADAKTLRQADDEQFTQSLRQNQ